MPERIYTRTEDGKLEALEEREFPTEFDLQSLIENHPELLDGEQISPGNARRWLLITPEKGIAPSSGASALWAVDHLMVDQDAKPTLVEVKRGSNPEIRRTIVGQLLEYAAHAAETWTSDELRRAFEEQVEAKGLDINTELAKFLQRDEDSDFDDYWDDVARNLAAKRLRLLFVADDIPDPLAQVVSFLNAQMPNIEVLAVEIKRFHGESAQTLVPRVMGRISVPAKGRGRKSAYSGKRIFAITEGRKNPRREDTHGYRSFAIVANVGAKGILFEDYIEAGGRPNDLKWDLDHEYVTIE